MNSIAAYCIAHLFETFISDSLKTHVSSKPFLIFGKAYEPLLQGASILFIMWLLLFWMYRKRLFLRI